MKFKQFIKESETFVTVNDPFFRFAKGVEVLNTSDSAEFKCKTLMKDLLSLESNNFCFTEYEDIFSDQWLMACKCYIKNQPDINCTNQVKRLLLTAGWHDIDDGFLYKTQTKIEVIDNIDHTLILLYK